MLPPLTATHRRSFKLELERIQTELHNYKWPLAIQTHKENCLQDILDKPLKLSKILLPE